MNVGNFLILLILIAQLSCSGQATSKINGVSFVASRVAIDSSHISPVVNINANFAAVMPFGFIRDLQNPEIIYNTDRQWFGESKAGAKQYIQELHKKGIKVMMKPHIWMRGAFTGHMKMTSEAHWKELEKSYSAFILDFAELAEETNAEILCIGTELEQFVVSRPQFWNNLIREIKTVFKGKLTYAANWDEFKRTPFWDDMDYIGVDAYFPVSNSQTPTLEECLEGWAKHKAVIQQLSDKFDRPVLFTEFGYRSVDYSGKEPWKSDRYKEPANFEAQNNTTEALFKTFWHEDWFAGGFIWKWFHNHERSGGSDDNQFTPQNKPVEAIIKAQFSIKD